MDSSPLAAPSRNRRLFLLGAAGLGLTAAGYASLGAPVQKPARHPLASGRDEHNFRHVYGSPQLRSEFLAFLTNVFHLYPEAQLDEVIAESVRADPSDPAVYQRLERALPDLSPWLGAFRYALPALRKQKAVMAQQTLTLLGNRRRFEGYLELGSHGRYLSALDETLEIRGPIFTTAPKPPTHSPEDIVDRGRLSQWGTSLAWTDYQPLSSRAVAPGSLQLITAYIGFHHCPLALRDTFIGSLREALAPQGVLILRDHDVTNQDLSHLVGLAHDVFNAGTHEPWSANEREQRNFYPLSFLVSYLEQRGFRAEPGRLLQAGDPTLNTLLCFSRA